jgi:hypothetical protein
VSIELHTDEGQPTFEEVPRRRKHPLSMKKRVRLALPIGPFIGALVLALFLSLIVGKTPRWIAKRLAQVYGLVETPPSAESESPKEPAKPLTPDSPSL